MNQLEEFKKLCRNAAENKPAALAQDRPVWIFGAGNFGRDLSRVLQCQGYQIAGFVETEPKKSLALNLPVRSWQELSDHDKTSQLAVGIFNRDTPVDALEHLARNAGFTDVFMPWHIYTQFGKDLGWRYWLSAPQVILDALPEIERTWHSLKDEKSRKCLLDILSFRLGLNNKYAGFSHEENRYFNEITISKMMGKNISYLDGGAYNGDTYQEACTRLDVSEAWLFEPDPENYKMLVSHVKATDGNAICLPCALSDSHSILTFNGSGEGGTITEGGSKRIMALSLDELLPSQRVDMVKLDIEGAEIPALRGAKELIKRSCPVLALSLYHRPQDVWEIPAFVRSICPDYNFYIRQHDYNSFESVFYAVPIKS